MSNDGQRLSLRVFPQVLAHKRYFVLNLLLQTEDLAASGLLKLWILH